MKGRAPDIIVVTSRIDPKELARLTSTFFEDMVKYVVDIEYTSLINIRPAQGNRSMLVEDADVRRRIRELTFALIGEGEPLS